MAPQPAGDEGGADGSQLAYREIWGEMGRQMGTTDGARKSSPGRRAYGDTGVCEAGLCFFSLSWEGSGGQRSSAEPKLRKGYAPMARHGER